MTTKPQLTEAIKEIDAAFSRGFASMHPELVGQYLIAQAIQEIDETVASTVKRLFDLSSGTDSFFKFLGLK